MFFPPENVDKMAIELYVFWNKHEQMQFMATLLRKLTRKCNQKYVDKMAIELYIFWNKHEQLQFMATLLRKLTRKCDQKIRKYKH